MHSRFRIRPKSPHSQSRKICIHNIETSAHTVRTFIRAALFPHSWRHRIVDQESKGLCTEQFIISTKIILVTICKAHWLLPGSLQPNPDPSMGTSLIRKRLLGTYRRTIPRVLWWS